MGDDVPGPSRGRGSPTKYATAEEARAARNAARRNRRRVEEAMDETEEGAQRERHESSTEISTAQQQEVQLGFRLHVRSPKRPA